MKILRIFYITYGPSDSMNVIGKDSRIKFLFCISIFYFFWGVTW